MNNFKSQKNEQEIKNMDDILFEDFKNNMLEEIEVDETIVEDTKEIAHVTIEQAVKDYNNGIEEAFDYIYAYYEPILNRWGKRCNLQELSIDLLHVVLLNSVKAFNETLHVKFNTYFWTCAKYYIHVNNTRKNAQKRQHYKNMLYLDQEISNKKDGDGSKTDWGSLVQDENFKVNVKREELKMSILALKEFLKPNEIKILLKIIDNYQLNEIGKEMGITTAAVCQTLKRLSKKRTVAGKLKDLLMD